jgi:hypothetical protein
MAVKSLHALSFVPLNCVYRYFCTIMGQFEDNQETRRMKSQCSCNPIICYLGLITYFVQTWIGYEHIHNNFFLLDGHALAVDTFLLQEIVQHGRQQRAATFPMQLWNLSHRIEEGLSRTNNAIESFFHIWNSYLRPNPPLSTFIRRVIKEDARWRLVVEDFQLNPADVMGFDDGFDVNENGFAKTLTCWNILTTLIRQKLCSTYAVSYKISEKL